MTVRALLGVIVLGASLGLGASPALASCAPPAPTAENAGRAEAVVYGTVTDASGGAITLRVDRVLKGSAGASVRVFVGPGRGGSGGSAVATSIDYQAAVGSDHVIYLQRAADGQLETSACNGSHAGPPTAEETALFGAGSSPAPSPAPAAPGAVYGTPSLPQVPAAAWAALALVAVLALSALLLGRRRGGAS